MKRCTMTSKIVYQSSLLLDRMVQQYHKYMDKPVVIISWIISFPNPNLRRYNNMRLKVNVQLQSLWWRTKLVHFLNGGSLGVAPCLPATAACRSSSLIQLADDGAAHFLQLLLMVLVLLFLSHLVVLQPADGLITLLNNRLLVLLTDFAC